MMYICNMHSFDTYKVTVVHDSIEKGYGNCTFANSLDDMRFCFENKYKRLTNDALDSHAIILITVYFQVTVVTS